MPNALLEIGCEEIPARFMPGFLQDLKEKAAERLKKERLSFERLQTLGTYRRLTLYVEGLTAKQPDLAEEIKGPPADISYDQSGRPTQAALGFARSQGVTEADLVVKPAGKKDYIFARVSRRGQPAEQVLARLFPELIASLYQPLAMRWGELDFKFIRPIHWIVALCGSKVVKFELAGIKSGNKTAPHRYLKNVGTGLVPVRVNGQPQGLSLHSYKAFMAKLGVVVDQEERKEMVREQVTRAAKEAGAAVLIEGDLLDEVTYLVERPKAYVGEIDPVFLQLPQQVLITSMKKNQKYFPLLDPAGKMQARFVVVTDNCGQASVVRGNQKVLTARLSDARFFFEEDRKVPLEMRRGDLERVGFFEKLGTMAHKSERLGKLAEWFGKRLGLDEAGLKRARRIAELCKADLTTKMVYEFPELQGVMGREYALLAGEDPVVAQGIYEHYLPRYADDGLPASLEGTAVALADRFDSLVGCFSLGAVPTGSVDPYGLRRAVNGIIRLVLDKKLELPLDQAIEQVYKSYERVFLACLFEQGETGYQDFSRIKTQLLEFIAGRLRPLLLERGIRYDVVDAALGGSNDILDGVARAEVINHCAGEEWFAGVVRSADRVGRISKDSPRDAASEADLEDEAEQELFNLYMKVNWEVGEAVNREEWDKALRALAALTDPIEKFFDQVLVMHQDERLKSNRLALLKSLEKLYQRVADLRKVVLPG